MSAGLNNLNSAFRRGCSTGGAVDPNQIASWKAHPEDRAADVFDPVGGNPAALTRRRCGVAARQVGELTVDLLRLQAELNRRRTAVTSDVELRVMGVIVTCRTGSLDGQIGARKSNLPNARTGCAQWLAEERALLRGRTFISCSRCQYLREFALQNKDDDLHRSISDFV